MIATGATSSLGGGSADELGQLDPGRVTEVASSVTAAPMARSLPCTTALVLAVIDVTAITVPAKVESTPRVAELPASQKTLRAVMPPVSVTRLDAVVTSVLAALMMKTDLASPRSVSEPVMVRAPPS